jgi:hypothetical protein
VARKKSNAQIGREVDEILMPWYRWAVNYREGSRIRQEVVESTTHRDAIIAARMMHPRGSDFAAIKLSTRPLK